MIKTFTMIFLLLFGCMRMEEYYLQRRGVIQAKGDEDLEVMAFDKDFSLDKLPAGWRHQTFLRHDPMEITVEEKEGVWAIRLDTDQSASMLFRYTNISLDTHRFLKWRWLIEKPLQGAFDETASDGDDHAARVFLTFLDRFDQSKSLEVVWARDLKPGTYKFLGEFPHYVARSNQSGTGVWHRESIDLVELYESIWKEPAQEVQLVDVALFCDSDNTKGRSTAYFADVVASAIK